MDVVPEESPEQCPICYDHGPEVVLGCGHMFCKTCIGNHKKSCRQGWNCGIGQWENIQKIKATCPMCRGEDVTEHPIGDHLKAAIQKQVDKNPHIENKNIAYTRADGVAIWLMKQLKNFGCYVRCDEADAI